jgi:hypothetical protein
VQQLRIAAQSLLADIETKYKNQIQQQQTHKDLNQSQSVNTSIDESSANNLTRSGTKKKLVSSSSKKKVKDENSRKDLSSPSVGSLSLNLDDTQHKDNSDAPMSPSSLGSSAFVFPDRNSAFEHFKKEKGAELAKALLEAKGLFALHFIIISLYSCLFTFILFSL